MRRLYKAILLSLVAILLISMPILAAVAYRAAYTIIESGGTAYDMLAVSELVDNQWLADNGFMQDDALDTRIETLGGLIRPHMVATNKTLTSVAVPADSQTNLYFTTANTALSSMDIITGYDGYITIDDAATLELGSDFEIEQSGYVDTSNAGMYSNLVHKRSAAGVSITDTNEISGIVYLDEPEELIPSAFNAWTDVDVSAYVPTHATGLVVHLATEGAAKDVGVRINGSADVLKNDLVYHGWSIVGIDANNIFDLFLEDATAHCYLVGFTGSDFTYKVAADDISLVAFGAWTDIDLSAEAPNATGAIIVTLNNDAVQPRNFGYRMEGSGDARINDAVISGISWTVIGCDGSQVIEGWAETLDVDCYLVGYITDNVTFFTNGVDKSFGAGFGAWNDIDCSGDVTPLTTHIIFEMVVLGGGDYGFRRNGSAEDIRIDGDEHFWAIVECDESQVVEGWAQFAAVDWFIIGYIEGYIQSPYERSAIADSISTDEYTVKTYGVANEPAWATGDVLHFTGANDSNINCGAIHNASAKMWVSLRFKLDQDVDATLAAPLYIFGKRIDGDNFIQLRLEDGTGKLQFYMTTLTVARFNIYAENGGGDIVSWNAGQWYHGLVSISDVNAVRFIVDNGTVETDPDVTAIPNGGDFVIGGRDDPGAGTGFIGEIQNVIVGTDDLTTDEEAALYAGTAPGDETNYWYIDEGTGTTTYDYGTGGNDGTIDNAPTWETSTFTTGSTGRLCDFYIEVDDGVGDPARWGDNLKGASVPDNANDWYLNQNNVMPYMDYYYHTVAEVRHAWYQPNDMVTATDSGGTETAGGSAVLITAAEITEGVDYWLNALVTITGAGGVAPEGETRYCSASAVGSITVGVAFSANVDIGDTFTVDFGTLIDRSYYALEFDGVDDTVTFAVQDFTAAEYSTEVWIKVNTFAAFPHIISTVGVALNYTRFANDGSFITLENLAGTEIINLTYAFAIDTWYHIVITDDTVTSTLYVNGNLEDSDTIAGGRTFDRLGGARFLPGIMDEVRIYDRVLGLTEIQANYNSGQGSYTPYSSSGLAVEWHMEDGSGVVATDTSGNGIDGTLVAGTAWTSDAQVPRPAGNSGTNDSRLSWGANPSGVAVTLGGMVNVGQPTPGALPADPARDILLETPVTDWFGDHTVSGDLLTNPVRPFVTMLSDNTTLTEIQSWRLLALAAILLVTGATALAVGRHQGITAIVAGTAILGIVVLTIFPLWALVFAIGMFIGGLVMERAPSL